MGKENQSNVLKHKMGVMREYFRKPNNIALIATIKGEINEDDLRDALKKITKIHPLTGVRVVIDSDQDAWFTDEDVPPAPLKIIKRRSERQSIGTVEKEHEIPFDFNKGPLIRFVLLKSEEVSDIIIICQHSICDGLSLTILLQDIIFLLDNPTTKIKKVNAVFPISDNFQIPFRVKLRLLKNKFIMNRINRKWDDQALLFDDEDYQNVHEAYFQKFRYKIVNLNLSEEETSNLIAKCRENQVTVNSAISVALLSGRKNIRGNSVQDDSTVQIAVDIRNQLKRPGENVFGFLASGIKIEFEYPPETAFWDNVRLFHQIIISELKGKRALENLMRYSTSPTLTDAINFAIYGEWVSNGFKRCQKLLKFIRSNNKAMEISKQLVTTAPDLTMSNLGQIKTPEAQNNLQLDRLYFITSSYPYLDLVAGLVTINGKLTLTMSYMEPKEDNSNHMSLEMEKIMHNAMDQLMHD